MTDIQPGDWVKCVDDRSLADRALWHPSERPVAGAVYRVTDVWPTPTPSGVSLEAEGLRRDPTASAELGYRAGYGPWRFRKLNRVSDQFRAKLLEPVDLGVDA